MRKSIGMGMVLLALLTHPAGSLFPQCNGDPALCSRRFDEVCYATTHNAFNYQGAFLFPNQTFDIAQQLQDGIRGLMLDVYWFNNQPTVYHSSNWLGNQPLADLLDDIQAFLDAHPNEVVSIIFESYITAAEMNDAFTQSGLLPYLHTQAQGQAWPTLQDMITANRRLVVFTDQNDGQAHPWYHYVWDFGVETHYTAHSRTDFSCAYNRGDSTRSLLILNHFLTHPTLGYGLPDSATHVNANPYLLQRAMDCWAATGKRPNFLTVDFYERGDVFAAKDAINAGSVGLPHATGGGALVVTNPVHDALLLQWKGNPPMENCRLSLQDLQGRVLLDELTLGDQQKIQIDLPASVRNGIYLYRVETPTGAWSGKVMVAR